VNGGKARAEWLVAPAAERAGNPLGCQAAPLARRVNYSVLCVCLIQSHINADKRSRFAASIASRRAALMNLFLMNLTRAARFATHSFSHLHIL